MNNTLNNFLVFNIIYQFFFRIWQFFKRWYWNGFFVFWKSLITILSSLDYTFAVKITLRYWAKPLYQDRTIVGYILGFIFRTGRILIGSVIYLLIFIIWLVSLLIWFSILPILIFGSIFGLPLGL
jgi:hypothetical protein